MTMGETTTSPPRSPRPALSLDLSNLPPLSQPSPPSNTLLITDLHDLFLFQPSSLTSIRELITSLAPLNSFSPLPSFRRIVCSFHSTDDAIRVRQHLDGSALLGRRHVRTRIYFGEPTPILDREEARRPKLLEAPHLDKLFFISPPPSPPHGWTMRTEEPPNKQVHATDLADALARLRTEQIGGDDRRENETQMQMQVQNGYNNGYHQPLQQQQQPFCNDPATPVSPSSSPEKPSSSGYSPTTTTTTQHQSSSSTLRQQQQQQQPRRSRSSTIIYDPEEHGGSPNLPAVMVEDTSADGQGGLEDEVIFTVSPTSDDVEMNTGDDRDNEGWSVRRMPPKTARPPVELMQY